MIFTSIYHIVGIFRGQNFPGLITFIVICCRKFVVGSSLNHTHYACEKGMTGSLEFEATVRGCHDHKHLGSTN